MDNIQGDNNSGPCLHRAVAESMFSVVQQLLEKGAIIDELDQDGNTPLLVAKDPDVLKTLILSGCNIRAKTRKGVAPLHLAAANGLPSIVQLLIDRGATVNDKDNNGLTPLHRAVKHEAVAKILLENGADIHAENKKCRTPLHWAVTRGAPFSVVRLLMDKGALVDARSDCGCSPLHMARSPEIAEELLRRGADVNSVDTKGRTSVIHAVKAGLVDVLKLLIKHGARVDKSVLTATPFFTPPEVFKFLLEWCLVDLKSLQEVMHVDIYGKFRLILHHHNIKMKTLTHRNCDRLFIHPLSIGRKDILFKNKCQAEVDRLKSQIFCGTGYDLRPFDILTRNEYQIACLMRNDEIARMLESSEWNEQFPIYGHIISYHIDKGKIRKKLEDDSVKLLKRQFRDFKELPVELWELIFSYLSMEDLFNSKR